MSEVKKAEDAVLAMNSSVSTENNGRTNDGRFAKGNRIAQGNRLGYFSKEFKQELAKELPSCLQHIRRLIAQGDKEIIMFAIKMILPPAKESTYIALNHKRLNSVDDLYAAAQEILEKTFGGEMSLEEQESAMKAIFNRLELSNAAEVVPVLRAAQEERKKLK